MPVLKAGKREEPRRRVGAVLTALRVRNIAAPDAARQRIVAEKDLEQLKRWLERAVVASSFADVIDELP